ncbi:MAG: hypothetical protein JXA53_08180, partial [Bacteroidales bacterium]|nr:hypothetical protein [Bacteroidales bacterium]
MGKYSPHRIAVILSFIPSTITAILFFTFFTESFEDIYLQIAVILLSIFIVNYIISFFLLN